MIAVSTHSYYYYIERKSAKIVDLDRYTVKCLFSGRCCHRRDSLKSDKKYLRKHMNMTIVYTDFESIKCTSTDCKKAFARKDCLAGYLEKKKKYSQSLTFFCEKEKIQSTAHKFVDKKKLFCQTIRNFQYSRCAFVDYFLFLNFITIFPESEIEFKFL